MPVLLRQDDEMRWLSRDVLPADKVKKILSPYPAELMEAYPVSDRVNSPGADDKRAIEPVKGL
jgi:putative SOS response-associated peptidase YedK